MTRNEFPIRHSVLALACAALCACSSTGGTPEPDETEFEPRLSEMPVEHATVPERFVSVSTPEENIDSPAAWMAPSGRNLLIATSKATGRLMAYDAETGASLGPRLATGTEPGQLLRPNGLFVQDDLLFVVERDNHRVQVFRLPGFEPLGVFGQSDLVQPYGIWLRPLAAGRYEVLVTDAYMGPKDARGEDTIPTLAELSNRLRRYDVSVAASGLTAEPLGSIGDTSAEGAIRVPESVWGDPANQRLLIAEEDVPTGTALREYRLDGSFAGQTIGLGLFKAQAEGISLWSCADGSGYWIATDQFLDRSVFHVFDRQSLAHIGAFAGNTVANTDGIWLRQAASASFPAGAFYAVHDDQAVAAFDWRDIARALSLRTSCTQ